MSERGVFAVDRGVWDHPLLMEQDAPYSRIQAWIWLLSEASWKQRVVKAGDAVVTTRRGELAHSIRYIAEAWCWKPAKVQRFLVRLKTDTMIDTRIESGTTVISICKYDEYQRVSLPKDTAADTPTDTAAIQQRYRKEDREYKEDKFKEDTPSGATVVAFPAKVSDKEVYALGKLVLGKSAGGVITNLRKACEFDDALAVEYLRQASEKHDGMEWIQGVIKASLPENRAYAGVENYNSAFKPIPRKEDRQFADWRDDPIYRGAI